MFVLAANAQEGDFSFTTSRAREISKDKFYLVEADSSSKDIAIGRKAGFVIVKGSDIIDKVKVYEIDDNWKLSSEIVGADAKSRIFYVKLYDQAPGLTINPKIQIEHVFRNGILKVRGSLKNVRKYLLPHENIVFIQVADRKPKEESSIRQHDLATNAINVVHNHYPDLNGATLQVSVKENLYDTADFDIEARAGFDEASSPIITQHASDMATLIGGAGITFLSGRGVAREVGFHSTNFLSLLPEPISYYESRNINVQNHSYGVEVENFYGVESAAYDQLINENEHLVHSFSIGNSGSSNGTGEYEDVPSYGTMTGSFKQAKNVLVVSATDSLGTIPTFISRGPAYDGRIKPDLVAFGGEGSSDAAALISGAAILLQERHQQLNGVLPTSSMIRGLLIAGSNDILAEGPDFISGYGELDLFQSMKILDSGWHISGSVSEAEIETFHLEIPGNISMVTFALSWNDLPANEGDDIALVNDLDVRITRNGEEWLPWILDSSPDINSLETLALTGVDHLNNTEMITIENPQSGTHQIVVTGSSVVESQSFSIAYRLTEENSFDWRFPTASDRLEAGMNRKIRWRTTLQGSAILEINYMEDEWYEISSSISLQNFFQNHSFRDTTSFAKLRMRIGSDTFESDTFLIALTPLLQVDLNCEEDLVLKWDDFGEVSYSVKKYKEGFLEEVSSTVDTFLIVKKSQNPETQYVVQPIVKETKGVPSRIVDIDQQAVGCFVNSFFAFLNEEGAVNMTLNLSGVEFIEDVKILKRVGSGVDEVLNSFDPVTDTYNFIDPNPGVGVTTYQAWITSQANEQIFSEEVQIFNTDENTFLNFPNPVTDEFFYFLTPTTGSLLQLMDRQGKIVQEIELRNELEEVVVEGLPDGIYYYRVLKDGNRISSGKMIFR